MRLAELVELVELVEKRPYQTVLHVAFTLVAENLCHIPESEIRLGASGGQSLLACLLFLGVLLC